MVGGEGKGLPVCAYAVDADVVGDDGGEFEGVGCIFELVAQGP